jgi:hemerythrin-like domain-containing protein
MADVEVTAVRETLLIHNLHRAASTLLAEAAIRPSAPADALTDVRDFLVAQLRAHHEMEDDILWPKITAVAPAAAGGFAGLTEEHERLDAALDATAAAPVDTADRTELATAAAALRDLVHTHLAHEEPLLFPALRAHISEAEWADFSKYVVKHSPDVASYLLVGFLEQAGTPGEADIVLGRMPAAARQAMREQSLATIGKLSAA